MWTSLPADRFAAMSTVLSRRGPIGFVAKRRILRRVEAGMALYANAKSTYVPIKKLGNVT